MKTLKILSRNSLRFITLAVLSSVSFSSLTAIAQTDPKVINAYKEAITDSIKTEPGEITNKLTIIGNPPPNPNPYWDEQGRVLVVTFTDTPDFEASNEIWVTVAPELKSFCTTYKSQNPNIKTAQLNQQIEQILGIPPGSGKAYVVELWVDPAFLKRPAISPDTKKVEISNPDFFKTGTKDTFSKWLNEKLEHRKDLQNKLMNLSNPELLKEYPWTGLGYTFNWAFKLKPANQSIKEFGLSEFIVWEIKDKMLSSGKASLVQVKPAFTTKEYCTPK